MKIGYITKEDPNDVRAYSGTHYSMYQALKSEFDEVVPLGPIDHWYKYPAKLKGRIKTFGTDKVFKFQYDIELAKKHTEILDKRILKEKPDVLLGSLVSPEVAFLETSIPLYLTTDATFPLLQDLYKSHSNLYSESIKNAMILERKAFEKAKKLLLPLDWLSKSARNHYRIPKDKIEVIPYGTNIKLPDVSIEELINNRVKSNRIKFLFVGVRWIEKGGPKAVAIIEELNKLGIDSSLKVVGCSPNLSNENIDVVGFLDKQNPKQLAQLIELYQDSSFFILPTKAECVGMSFIEAASFGLPAIGTNVGGVPEAVVDHKTGLVFNADENPQEIALEIEKLWNEKTVYEKMSKAAHVHYSQNMNWRNWAKRVREIITNLSSI
tara:strand:- start:726 stop:1865 length:1140 start_codon:yes stop_codon:yes gene_type:complete